MIGLMWLYKQNKCWIPAGVYPRVGGGGNDNKIAETSAAWIKEMRLQRRDLYDEILS
jgi:hypothetical protein